MEEATLRPVMQAGEWREGPDASPQRQQASQAGNSTDITARLTAAFPVKKMQKEVPAVGIQNQRR